MSAIQFFQTKMGSKFFEHDFPRAVKALETIAAKMDAAPAAPKQEEAGAPSDTAVKKMAGAILDSLTYPHLCSLCSKGCEDEKRKPAGVDCQTCIAEFLRNAAK